ncbi:non-ribosomal peptide synthetase [Pseudomonas syringae]|uniref:Non-ribosomal peptide synthetase n=1 Tax=Pseudomonas syringae TaxID=317 RepID=A0A244EVE1_PSESX|nr:non-ribosomal peptide synthetase [Pseudomonas syringae]OUM08507.1 non-ribosomal peptide synthetase [Pseudomonas syringae]
MSINELLATLKAHDIHLTVKDGQLVVQGNRRALSDNGLLDHLRTHKPALIELIGQGDYTTGKRPALVLPPNAIPAGCEHITAQMLTLVELDQGAIDRLIGLIPGGAANVQDLYPLAPLQQGILYHHVTATHGDPYVMRVQFAFSDQARLDAFARGLQTVIDRHDILRTSVHWDSLETPLQVVWRHAELKVDTLPTAEGITMDLRQAPLMRLVCHEPVDGKGVQATLLFHHIAMDHSALEVVRHEIQACLSGQLESLGVPVPFRNYVGQALLGVSEQEHEVFFRDMLGDLDEPTLAYDLQDLSGEGDDIDEHSITLDLLLCQRLRGQARSLGVSVASLFHLGWARVLAGLTGQQRVVFGTVLMGRLLGAEATERALGIFINTLPLRINLSDQDVVTAVRATHQRLTALMRHEHAPLALAQRCSGVTAPTPLFNALLNYRHSAPAQASGETWQGIEVLHAQERSNYPLVLSVDDLGEAFGFTAQTSPGIDPQRICAYLQRAMESLLDALEQAPHMPAERIDVVPPRERGQLLSDFNPCDTPYERFLTLHQRIEQHAQQRPDATAAQVGEQRLSYGELNRRANGLAHHLISLGVQPDDRVAVVARRGLETLIGLLAVLKAGAGYVPVDPAHPDERIAYLLNDSAPVAVLTQQPLLARLRALDLQGPLIDLERPVWPEQQDSPQVVGLGSTHLAYVIYTSGSTGQPKGVMVEHRTLNNLIDWHREAFDLSVGSHTASMAGFGFDAMAWEVWPALCAGATLHLPPADIGNEQLDALLDWWLAQPLQVAFLPTPVAEYAFSRDLRHPTLRTLLIGGDRLRQFHRDPGFAVINNYGPTETTVVATSGRLLPDGSLDIGKPIANTSVYLLDEQQQLVPLGMAGELYIGGDSVARGYLNQPQLTAERFLRDPFAEHSQARMYRTGDLARWNADGTLEYLGRNDDQVKIRGVRIELGEIESQFSQLPGIEEALVLAREDEPGQPRLVGYFTERAEAMPTTVDDLRAALASRLPAYMVPSALVRLDRWPLTANGKVDRRALPVPDRDALSTGEYEAPQGELEHALALIWSELLQVERVGRHDRFFELGGHSLLAMRMVSQVRQRLSLELALGDLFADSSLSAVAQCLAAAARSQLPDIDVQPRTGPVPLSSAQQRIWFMAQMEDANSAYNISLGLKLNGPLDADALTRALERIVARHDSLRSRFSQEDDNAWVQAASVTAVPDICWQDLRGQDADALRAVAKEEAAQPFDLQNDLPIRGRLLCLAEDRHVLLLTVHHIVADGWSLGVLTRELTALYQAFSQGLDDPLPALALQYGDYAVWQRHWLDGERLSHQGDYWQQALAGAPVLLTLPTDRPRPAHQDYTGASVALNLDTRLSADLRAFCQAQSVTPFMVFMGAWAVLLARLSGQEEVVVGMPVANRRRADIEGLIGLFVNTLAVRVDTSGEPDVMTLLARIKARVVEAQDHQDLPFEQVVERLRPPRSLAHSPLFQASLTWDGSQGLDLQLGDLQLEPLEEQAAFAKFDLALSVSDSTDHFRCIVEYATALFDRSTVERHLGYLEAILRGMVAGSQTVPNHIPLLSEAERRQLVDGFNAPDRVYPQGVTLHSQFEAQVQRTPDAIAVSFEDTAWSYATLNAQANKIAHRLIGMGIGVDDRVAICTPRGLQMIAGLLGILKAGAAYVPLDPAYPLERLAYTLGDSAPVALLTQRSVHDALPVSEVPVVSLDDADLQDESDADPQVSVKPSSLAYVIYTSGSTGLPKGVMIEHRNVARLFSATEDWFSFNDQDVWALFHSFAFDFSVWEIWGALLHGGRLLIVPQLVSRSPEDFYALLCRDGVTVLNQTPSAFRQLIAAQGENGQAHSLRKVIFGGEALETAMLKPWYARNVNAGTHLVNMYGITETTVHVTYYPVLPEDAQRVGASPIGRRIPDLQLYVLDARGEPVPVGVVGELYVGGAGVARGYLNREALTAERFLDNPFSHAPDARIYRTGDLGRWMADGSLEYLGRNDEQVKIRGFRIELGEIASRLNDHPDVIDAVVIAREDVPGDKRLVAYYTCAEDKTGLDIEQLRAWLSELLPDYMVPAAFVRLAGLPVTANGKLDRKSLPAPDRDSVASRAYEAPQGATEIALARLWAELLQVDQVGRQDNFFESGGHSLLAVTLIARMRRLDMKADIRVLFVQPTLAALAAAVGQDTEIKVPANLIDAHCQRITPELLPLVALDQPAIDRIVAQVPGGAANVQDIYPLGPLQTGILYHHLKAGDSDPYLLQPEFAFADASRLDAFCHALQRVIERNDILRTALLWEGLQAPVQVVWRQAPLRVQETALHDLFNAPRMELTHAPLMHLVYAHDPSNQRIAAVLRYHHVIMDHIALDVLSHELQAILLDDEARLAAPVPYRNYIAHVLQGPGDDAHEAFFREQLGDVDEPTLPYGLAMASAEQIPGEARLTLEGDLCRQVRDQARQLGVSAATVMHLAWAQVLGQLSGRDSVVFGTVLFGRLRGGEGGERALGVFINTLPLRMDLSGHCARSAVLDLHARLVGMFAHEHAQLALAQRCSALPAGAPLFNTLLNYRHSAEPEVDDQANSAAWQGIEVVHAEERSNYPLTLSVDDFGDSFGLTAQAAPGIDPQRICAYVQQALVHLVQALEQQSETALIESSVVPPAERERLLTAFNDTRRDYPREQPVHRLFERRAALHPHAIAALHGRRSLTYGELNERANHLAHYLMAQGVKPSDHVAVLLPRSLELLISQLAIGKCAATYVPLDVNAPADRQNYMLEDCQAVCVLTQSATSIAASVRRIDLDHLHLDDQPAHDPGLPQTSDTAAYVMYTSGSTGAPKGVRVPHRGIARLVLNNSYADLNEQDSIAFVSNPAFDASTLEVWGALLNGGQIFIIEHSTLIDPVRFSAALRHGNVSVLFLTTALFNQYVQLIPEALVGLRMLISGGERADPVSFRTMLAQAPGLHLLNAYGPTETTTFATACDVRVLAESAESVPIGRPIGNTRLYVLDAHQRLAPLGAIGELYIGGDGVALGYLNRPELTDEKFIADPFSTQPGATMYRTGDLGRWLEDGQLECLGRNDDQVKIRGFRIELGEIVNCLHQLPGIRDAVVMAREDEPGNVRLVAYFTGQPEVEAPSPEQMRAHVQASLPEYMVPGAFIELTALPLTANGKLDMRALPKPDHASLFSMAYEPPQGDIEIALAQIWAEVLQVERVGRYDHFFDLGGHSLLAMRMVSQVRQQLGMELPLGELFALGELAAVAAALAGAGRSELSLILPAPRDQSLPLSFAQQRLWFLAQLEGGSEAYNIPLALSLRGALDVTALTTAVSRIVERHETLRSRFIGREEGAEVVFASMPANPLLHVEDLRQHPDVLNERVVAEAAAPFDLARGPLIRGSLLQLEDQRHVLLLTVHHIVADGWSMGVLTRELLALYSAFRQGKADPLPALAIQYADYAVWQQSWMSGERLQHQAAYWHQTLDGAPTLLTLPTDRVRPAQQDFAGASLTIRLEGPLTAGLRALAQRQGVTLYMILMTAWAALLARLSGQTDVVVGSPIAGRGRAELEGLIGLFVNTLAVRIDMSSDATGEALLAQVRTRVLEAQDHQDLPFEQVVEIVRPARSLAHAPLFQTTLNWLAGDTKLPDMEGLSLALVEQSTQVAKFDLSLNLGEHGDALVGTLDYATALFDETTVQRYGDYFEQLLHALVSDQQAVLAQVPLVGKQERQYLLEGLNDTGLSFAQHQTVHGLIEAQAARLPAAIAAQVGEQSLSYGELNRKANSLAHYLIGLGVCPDDRVAVVARRGLDTLVGLLAVLKAGACYVPVDPAHPGERIAYLLSDSAPVAVLAQHTVIKHLPALSVPVIALDRPQWLEQPHNPVVAGLTSTDLAYVIYTSGSTGQPKGVMVEHGTLANLVYWHCQAFDLHAGSHTASVAGFGFDAMAWEVWPALCAGATLHVPPADVSNEQLDALLDWWIAQPLQVAFLPTPVAEYAFSRELRHPTLKTLLIGGDRLRQFHRDPGFAVINNYGPTETTVVATSGRLLPDGNLDIGKPIANTRAYLLDDRQQLVPLGVAGELYIGGEGVARGYLNQPQLTAERFLRDPFAERPQARMYRTGDLARWNADGTLEYLGRNDDQVKIRGVRIELGEIEAQLAQLPGIEEALVLAREDEPGQPRLVAYFIERAKGSPVGVAGLRTGMLARLPGYMVPSAFVRLDAWPLTANGKVDRRALPAPDREALPGREYEAPQGDLETALAEIWADLLQVEQVGRHDHFFELGGHSLLAVTLIARMRRRGMDADIRVLFAQPTLAALASAVGSGNQVKVPANRIGADCTWITPDLLPLVTLDQEGIDRVVASVQGGACNVQDIYPLGPLQAGIFYHYLSAGEDDPYRLQARFAFADRSRLDAFCQALQKVIDRNDVLRTSLYWEGLETPVQVVWRHAALPVIEVPLAALDAAEPLSLVRAPLLRLVHADDPANQRIVAVLMFHHLIMDHVALDLLSQELQAVLLDQEALLPAPVPYRNYIAHTLLGPADGAHEAFFREQLGDLDEPTLPYAQTSLPGPEVSGEARLRLDSMLSQRVRDQVRQLGVSPASLMHLAWAQVLGHLSGRDQVVFGTVLIGRMSGTEGAERTLGVFINTLPLRIDLADQTARDAVLQTHQRLTGLLAHEHASLALAQRCSALPAGAPLFSALLNYRHSSVPQGHDHAADKAWQGIELLQTGERSSYPLTLSVDDLGEAFNLTALTSTGIDAQRVCAYLACAVENLVSALEQAPLTPVQALHILPATERSELLEGFNAHKAGPESTLTIQQRIEQHALNQPDAVAAQVGDQQLTYAELNRHANALAHHLIGLGVSPDDRVAVVARRGLETLTGLLAVLKAGASYVPVDPAHPDERLGYLLEDSTPVVVLAQSDLLARLPELPVPVISLDRADWPQRFDNPHVPGMTTRHLAYVIYTSGSTGLPKGVMVEHRTLNNLVDWHCQAFDLHAGSHTASVAGFGFDAMAWEVWPALCAGAVLHLPPAEIGNEQLDLLLDWWLAQPLQVSFLPTPVAEYAFSRELRHPTLQTLLIGGDRLRHFNRDPGFAVINNYGPTETTVVASSGLMEPGKVLHIGKPVTHAALYVLDSRGQPVPLGVPGELYIGGAGVARGYLNRPDLTAERFLDDPFANVPEARMYRTGDLVRWLADGTLEYLGRNDDQVKIRGVRIELGEIEQQLAQCPGIGEAVVTTQRLEDGALRLVGYFTRRDATLDSARLRAHLLGVLPEYMVPAVYVGLDALPLTQNGKVDRKALPAPDMDALANVVYQAPSSALEERLAQRWAEVLEVGRIGRHDSFFELGGHSLLAIRLVSLLQKDGLPLTLAELFQHPSIAALAGLLDQRPALSAEAQEIITVRAGGSEPPLFLVHDFTGLDAYFPVLGQHLQGDFPIYGLPGIGLGQQQLRTLECLAARLVERIRQVQPRGPYRLAGWSFGGVVAYEVATQLLGMDEAVTFLGLIDSYVPRLTDQGKARWQGPDLLERQLLSHCTAHWEETRDSAAAAALARLNALREQTTLPDFDALLQLCRDEHLLYNELAEASDRQLRHYLEREVAHGHALAHYQLEPLDMPVHLFCAEQRPMAPPGTSDTLGWGETLATGQLQCISVPGDHMSMMQAPNVSVLGQRIAQALASVPVTPPSAPASQSLLAIQSGLEGHAPLFCVPGAGDSVTGFIGLAEALGRDWPIYGLQPRGLDGRSVPHSRVEAAAQSYVQAIEAIYPHGPLHLVGHSFGGWAAHAMAVKLQARGREVASLTLIDSEAPGGDGLASKPYTATAALERLIEALQLSSGKRLELDPLSFADCDGSTQLHLLQEAMVRAGLLPPRMAPQALQGIVRTFASALRTVYRPHPGGYSGRASLVLVDDPHLDALDNQLEQASSAAAWQHLLPQLAVWEGPGNHFSVLKAPDVYSLAAWWYDGLAMGVGETQ